MVHKTNLLNDAQKLQYLKRNLSGEAAKIRHLDITGSNNSVAWESINNRFDNK